MSKTKSDAWQAAKRRRWVERHQTQIAIEKVAGASRDLHAFVAYVAYHTGDLDTWDEHLAIERALGGMGRFDE